MDDQGVPVPSRDVVPAAPRVAVEIWSDVVCPWCYLGKRRFEHALQGFAHAEDVSVVNRSFQLDPGAPPTSGVGLDQLLATKYGMSPEEARRRNADMVALASAEGLEYRLDRAQPGNTFDAHRVLHLATERGAGDAAWERFFRGYFTEGVAIGSPEAVAGMAAEVGLDPTEVDEVLRGAAYADAVRAEEAEARSLGCNGVPFFVVNRRYGVSGAQSAEHLHQVLERAWSEATA
jgi:predicted DsbA family dithiol-disulfide isomerase